MITTTDAEGVGMTTISAKLVAEGVGLPSVWMCSDCGRYHCEEYRLRFCPADSDEALWAGPDLTDPQTAFGLALKLDEWEAAPGEGIDQDQNWTEGTATAHRFPACSWSGDHILGMLARIEHIGMDHAIRRALGWSVEAGQLAKTTVEPDGNGGEAWVMWDPNGQRSFSLPMEHGVDMLSVAYKEVAT